MKPEHLAEEIRQGIKKLKARLDIPPAEDHDDLNGYMDALAEDADHLMNLIEAEKAELERQEPFSYYVFSEFDCSRYVTPDYFEGWCERDEQLGFKFLPLYTKPQPPAVPDGWQLIETAPKDGTRITLGTVEGYVWEGCYWQTMKRKADRWACYLGAVPFNPTHWRAKPAAPKEVE